MHTPLPGLFQVRKSISFHLTASSLDFGMSTVGKPAPVEHRIVISNIARGARHFIICCTTEVHYEGNVPAPYRAQVYFRRERTTTDGAEAQLQLHLQREDLLEKYKKKLRKYVRKQQEHKAKEVRRKIAALEGGGELPVSSARSDVESDLSDWGGNSESEAEADAHSSSLVRRGGGPPWAPPAAGALDFRVGRNGTQTVSVTLCLHSLVEGAPLPPIGDASVYGSLYVYESRDRDSEQKLTFSMRVGASDPGGAVLDGAAADGETEEAGDTLQPIQHGFRGLEKRERLRPVSSGGTLDLANVRGSPLRAPSPPRWKAQAGGAAGGSVGVASGGSPTPSHGGSSASLDSAGGERPSAVSPPPLSPALKGVEDIAMPKAGNAALQALLTDPLRPSSASVAARAGGLPAADGGAISVKKPTVALDSAPNAPPSAAGAVAAVADAHGAIHARGVHGGLAPRPSTPPVGGMVSRYLTVDANFSNEAGGSSPSPPPSVDGPAADGSVASSGIVGGQRRTLELEGDKSTSMLLSSRIDELLYVYASWSAPASPSVATLSAELHRVTLSAAMQPSQGGPPPLQPPPRAPGRGGLSTLELHLPPRGSIRLFAQLKHSSRADGRRVASLPASACSMGLVNLSIAPSSKVAAVSSPEGAGRAAARPTDGGDAADKGGDAASPAERLQQVIALQYRPLENPSTKLRLEPTELNFGEVSAQLDKGAAGSLPTALTFKLVNAGDVEANFVLMLRKEESGPGSASGADAQRMALTLHPSNGFIAGGGSCTVSVRCVAPPVGRQRYTVLVRNLSHKGGLAAGNQDLTLQIKVHGVQPSKLAFPDLEEGVDSLALGLCYVQQPSQLDGLGGSNGAAAHKPPGEPRQFLRKVPFRVTNLHEAPRRLSVTSNLLKQVFIFTDESCARSATELLVEPRATATVWICLQPNLREDVLSGGVCRKLGGGIRVQMLDEDGAVVDDRSISFNATIGRSLMRLSHRRVHLGRVNAPQQPPVAIVHLSNGSQKMPLEWEAVVPQGVRMSPTCGSLAGSQSGSELSGSSHNGHATTHSGALVPKSSGLLRRTELSFKLECPKSGYYRRLVELRDLNRPEEPRILTLEAMVDDGRIVVELPEAAAADAADADAADAASRLQMPVLDAGTLHALVLSYDDDQLTARSSLTVPSGSVTVASSVTATAASSVNSSPKGPRPVPSPSSFAERLSLSSEEIEGTEWRPGKSRQLSSDFSSNVSSSHTDAFSEGGGGARSLAAYSCEPMAGFEVLPGPAEAAGAHCSFHVRNVSEETLTFLPTSDLPISAQVLDGASDGAERALAASRSPRSPRSSAVSPEGAAGGEEAFAPCGDSFALAPGGRAQLRIQLHSVPSSAERAGGGAATETAEAGGGGGGGSSTAQQLRLGALFRFDGVLLLEAVSGRQEALSLAASGGPTAAASTAVRVQGQICVSLVTLPQQSISLGKVGYVNEWRDAEFSFDLRNESAVATSCRVAELPKWLELPGAQQADDGSWQLSLERNSTCTVLGRLRGSALEVPAIAEECSWPIQLINVHNPSNRFVLHIDAEVTVLRLRYQRLHWLGRGWAELDPRDGAGVDRVKEIRRTSSTLSLGELHEAAGDVNGADVGGDDDNGDDVGGDDDAAAMMKQLFSRKIDEIDRGEAQDARAEGAIEWLSALDAFRRGGRQPRLASGVEAASHEHQHEHQLEHQHEQAASLEVGGQRASEGGGGLQLAALAGLVLPPLVHPALPSTPPCSAWFELHNCSRETLNLQLLPEPSASLFEREVAEECKLAFEMLSRDSHTPIDTLALAPDARIELVMHAHLSSSAFTPALALLHRPLALGALRVRNESGDEDVIAVLGSLKRGATFALNVTHLNLNGVPQMPRLVTPLHDSPRLRLAIAPQVESFWIRNPSLDRAVDVIVTANVPEHVALVTFEPRSAHVAPDSEVEVRVTVDARAQQYVDDDAVLVVSDANAPDCAQTVRLMLLASQVQTDDAAGALRPLPASASADGETRGLLDVFELKAKAERDAPGTSGRALVEGAAERKPSVLGLKGAARVPGSARRHDVNLGQQIYGSGGVRWELRIENQGELPLRYRLHTVHTEEGDEWLSFSRSSGTLTQQHETQVVTLFCSTEYLEIYPTYVMLENLDDPNDMKTVLVSMDMLVDDSPASNYFSVFVDGRGGGEPSSGRGGALVGGAPQSAAGAPRDELADELRIDMGDVYYGVLYVNRSFVLENHTTMPLRFMISHNLRKSADVSISFSLSNVRLELFSTLVVAPNTSTRVYIHFRMRAPEARRADGAPSTAETPADASSSDLAADLAAVRASQLPPPEAFVLNGLISVSCQLVRDHQRLIRLSAACQPPQLGLSRLELEFSTAVPEGAAAAAAKPDGGARRGASGAPQLRIEPSIQEVLLTNVGRGGLSYAVRSSCVFFEVSAAHAEATIVEGDRRRHALQVRPNDEALRRHAAFLSSARHVEEHFTIYNRADLNEHRQVVVRLSGGGMHDQRGAHQDAARSSTNPTLGLSVLEEQILTFHGAFKAFWEARLSQLQARAAEAAAEAAAHPRDAPLADAAEGAAAAPSAPVDPLSLLVAECQHLHLDETYASLWFDFRHITDELVFYGIKPQTQRFVSPLANLCYRVLFQHEVFEVFSSRGAAAEAASQHGSRRWRAAAFQRGGDEAPQRQSFPPELALWVKQLSYFLMHFPDVHQSGINPLRRLQRQLLHRMKAERINSPRASRV